MKPTIICLTPVKNEAWILDNFLKSASLWADYIIIADQMSTDGSREIALKYPKVKLIDNNSVSFNEPERQKLLINEARKIQGQRLLITLDADEMFSPEIFHSEEWNNVLNSQPGTIVKFQWANFLPDYEKMWYGYYFPWGYMDDGAEHNEANKIHSGRIPLPENHPVIEVNEFKVIHFQFVNWERMESKHRYYQCMEIINNPDKSAVDIFRQYHHMLSVSEDEKKTIPDDWKKEYLEKGIDITKLSANTLNWFDKSVLDFFDQYGVEKFRKIALWNLKWEEMAQIYAKKDVDKYKDPRNLIDKIIQYWLFKTQNKLDKLTYRRIDRAIKYFFNY